MKTDQDILLDSTSPVEEKRAALAAIMTVERIYGWKKGMGDAETKLKLVPNPFIDPSQRKENYGATWMRDAGSKVILAAIDNNEEI